MQHKMSLAVASALLTITVSAAAQTSGPSTATPPYLVPTSQGVHFTSLLTVGDAVRKKHKGDDFYRMVGIPDGLGAFDNGDGTITVLMNHELGSTVGVVRAHGAKGAFVSKWQIRKSDLKVLSGEDLINTVYVWDSSSHSYVESSSESFGRFCSADLAKKTAFFNSASGLGFNEGRIFLNGEENGANGRAFAHIIQGRGNSATYELPKLGRFSWENAVASPFEKDKTIVAGLDDGSLGSSKVYFYIGTKQSQGLPVERAGLANGSSLQVLVDAVATEVVIVQGDKAPRRFSLASAGGTGFNRVEDGAWDTQNPNVFCFVTTASITTNGRLWKVMFDDVTQPQLGGTIRVVLDGGTEPASGTSGPKMMDNITVDGAGKVLVQEDPGNNSYIAKLWSIDPTTGVATELARFDAARFTPGLPGFITQDEESSGIIEVTELFSGVAGYDTASHRYFLLDAQVHKNISAVDPDLVEMGQLLMMRVAR
jgi:hypothetical protein